MHPEIPHRRLYRQFERHEIDPLPRKWLGQLSDEVNKENLNADLTKGELQNGAIQTAKLTRALLMLQNGTVHQQQESVTEFLQSHPQFTMADYGVFVISRLRRVIGKGTPVPGLIKQFNDNTITFYRTIENDNVTFDPAIAQDNLRDFTLQPIISGLQLASMETEYGDANDGHDDVGYTISTEIGAHAYLFIRDNVPRLNVQLIDRSIAEVNAKLSNGALTKEGRQYLLNIRATLIRLRTVDLKSMYQQGSLTKQNPMPHQVDPILQNAKDNGKAIVSLFAGGVALLALFVDRKKIAAGKMSWPAAVWGLIFATSVGAFDINGEPPEQRQILKRLLFTAKPQWSAIINGAFSKGTTPEQRRDCILELTNPDVQAILVANRKNPTELFKQLQANGEISKSTVLILQRIHSMDMQEAKQVNRKRPLSNYLQFFTANLGASIDNNSQVTLAGFARDRINIRVFNQMLQRDAALAVKKGGRP